MSDKWYISGPLGIGEAEPYAPLVVSGEISLKSPDSGIHSLRLKRTDEDDRVHEWAFWHMNKDYHKNALEIWEYKTDKSGKNCGGDAADGAMCGLRLVISEGGNVGIANELTVGAGGNAVLRTRHIEGKQGGIDDPDTLYLNWVSGKDVQVGEPSRKSNLFVCGNVGIGTTTPASGRLQFDNSLGNKVVIYDNGQTDRYGFGLNGGNLNAFVPAGGRFSIRQNGYDGTEVMTVTGAGNVGIGTSTPESALHVSGDLRISGRINCNQWRITSILTQATGPLNTDHLGGGVLGGSIDSSGGTLLILASGSGFSATPIRQIGMYIEVDRKVVGQAKIWANEAGSHKSFVGAPIVVKSIGAGSHTVRISPINSDTKTDQNDYFDLTVIELPFG
jgi:hypothetical protein